MPKIVNAAIKAKAKVIGHEGKAKTVKFGLEVKAGLEDYITAVLTGNIFLADTAVCLCLEPLTNYKASKLTMLKKYAKMQHIVLCNGRPLGGGGATAVPCHSPTIFAARWYACAAYTVIPCPSVRLSFCPSVTFVDSVETNKHIFKIFHHWVATPF